MYIIVNGFPNLKVSPTCSVLGIVYILAKDGMILKTYSSILAFSIIDTSGASTYSNASVQRISCIRQGNTCWYRIF